MKHVIFAAAAAMLAVLPAVAQEPAAAHYHNATGGKIIILPRDLEMRLAVNALPPHLREAAGILILGETGYVKVKDTANAFTCIVSRRGGNFYPVCFDEEGTRAILPAYMDDVTLRLKGESAESVERHMAEGFAQGLYRPPARPGIAYMLSPATYLLRDGKLTRTVAHVMFYAPYLTDADIGGVMGKSPFVDRPGPHGMIIVPAGQKERDAALAESHQLVEDVERAIGLAP